MQDTFRSRTRCMDIIRGIVRIDPWFASYAIEQLAQQADIRVINELTEGLESIVEKPELAGNPLLEQLLKERFQ